MCLFCKHLEAGRIVWPQADNGRAALMSAQLSMLLEGIDWRDARGQRCRRNKNCLTNVSISLTEI